MQASDEDIREVRKEIVEIRALAIRTNNLVSGLGSDLKAVAKKQQAYERRMVWNSAVAYLIFVVVIFGGLKMAYDVRVEKSEDRAARMAAERDELKTKLQQATKPLAKAVTRDEAAISALYEFFRNDNFEQVLAQWDRLRAEKVDEDLKPNERTIVRDLLAQARSRLSFEHFQKGLQAMHEGRWPDAEAELRQAISLDRTSPYITRVQFQLTEVLKAEGRCEEAISLLKTLMETDLDRDMADDYHLSLADCHERLRQFDQALTLYQQFSEKFENYPNKRWVYQKIRQLREITNQLQGTAAASPAGPSAPP